MNYRKYSIAAALLLACPVFAASDQFFDKLDNQLDASQYLSENAYGFLPVPIIITDPAVEGGLGMMGLFFHESEEERSARLKAMQDENNQSAAAHLMPPSVSAAIGAYTGNDSYFVGGGHLGFFKQGRIRYKGGIGYGNINIDFYGFGDVNLNKPIEITTQATGVLQTLKFKLGDSKFYFGPTQRYINASISPQNTNELIDNIPPQWQESISKLLTRDVATSGAGFTLEYDSRDNFFSPTQGLRYELNHLWFDDKIGSDIDYQLTELTALNYFKLSKNWRTGIRVAVNYANSDNFLPPYATPAIDMRGIPSARYQGLSVAMSALELVYKINFRWEVNAFVGAGKASNDFSDLASSQSKVSKGLGFRYLIARRYGFNMGVDIAKGPEDTVFYIQAGSAW
ncbi:outer membrane protein assembly factor [Colwellia sp. D2M02]|uniref:BamA/TamA family outer membrane protein n=1 Tax=Colwellia sp. D2M02 TaxID=2841562 RepID=UPI001C08702D|nr:outer membrane protein assembly factor [Colwellia sp. D2M02]